MKNLLLTTICSLAITGVAFAQGTVNWATPANAITAQTNAVAYSPLFGGGAAGGTQGATDFGGTTSGGTSDFYFALLYMPTTGTSFGTALSVGNFASWSFTGLMATNNASGTAGRLNPVAPNTGATVPWSNGTTNNIVLVGWSANLGTSWLSVSNELAGFFLTGQSTIADAYFGVSTVGYINPGTVNPGVSPFGTSAQSYGLPINSLNTQLYLLPVPEPTTLALAGLGGLTLLAFRRRKA
ncbi:MAG TPA: PEP-CTERM sorting domain-containing protein [Verrucomicrobiae bacterium]|nr:PEP-CTERM sorting domain-containing protein [Verrucomicrobiae bacterium]